MTDRQEPNRCRVVLIAPADTDAETLLPRLRDAVSGGDVSSLILPQGGTGEVAFQALAQAIVPAAQQAGVAVIIAGDTRIAGRVGADGIHLETGLADVSDAVQRAAGRLIVGAGGITTRDAALDIGEAQPDYVFFGKFGMDTKPEPHRRNLALGQWWAEMISIPCIVLAGSDIASVEAVAQTGAEFVALSSAVFGDGIDPAAAVAEANAILDRAAPRFGD
ncbi:MAG: thiamine phosphate synthase [Rhizobiaceae bacterium]|nr:thiamine phosphate synthase [Rhizobiaceae bacterium]